MTLSAEVDERAERMHSESLVFDALSLDYVLEPRYVDGMRQGGVDATIVTVAMGEEDWDTTLLKVESCLTSIDESESLELALSAADIGRIRAEGRIAVVIGFQGSSMIGIDFNRLKILKRLGLRSLQLTYTAANLYGSGCGENVDGGITHLGRDFVQAVNELGLLLDLSHCGQLTTLQGIELADNPIVTHANCMAIEPNGRNKSDEAMQALADKGGVMGICTLAMAVSANQPTLEDFLRHLDHAVETMGAQHVGIGLDLTEGYRNRDAIPPDSVRWRTLRPDIFGSIEEFHSASAPVGISTVVELPNVTRALLAREYDEAAIEGFLGANWLSVFERVYR